MKNRPEWNVIQSDISRLSENGIKDLLEDHEEVDLVTGGYPCQPFSYAGNREGMADIRGTLFYDFAMILKELKPKMFLVENVKGLATHDNGRTLRVMLETFENTGYRVQHKVLNALDYGVAQNRQRLIIIGIRDDLKKAKFGFPEPHKKKLVLSDVLKNVPDSLCSSYSPAKKEVLDLVPAGGCWRDLPQEVAMDYMKTTYFMTGGRTGIAKRLSFDAPAPTILCSPSQKQTERCHPVETRPLSVRESARIQSFPDSWEFCGSVTQQYKQVGNAVPVLLAEAIARSIKRHLGEL